MGVLIDGYGPAIVQGEIKFGILVLAVILQLKHQMALVRVPELREGV
jgi:hypothetical protein